MREKSKKTIKIRLLALLLVFCMTFQMISYSPGNVVRAEREDSGVSEALDDEGLSLPENTPVESVNDSEVVLQNNEEIIEEPQIEKSNEAPKTQTRSTMLAAPKAGASGTAMSVNSGSGNPYYTVDDRFADISYNPFGAAASEEDQSGFAKISFGGEKNADGSYDKGSEVKFQFDLALNDAWLSEAYDKLGIANPDTADEILENMTINPIKFVCDLGDNFDIDTLKDEGGKKIDENNPASLEILDGSETVVIGQYYVKNEDGRAVFCMEATNNVVYNRSAVRGGAGFSMSLSQDAATGADKVDVAWDDGADVVSVTAHIDPVKPPEGHDKYSLTKTAEPTVDSPYIDYTITAKIPPDGGNLAGKTLIDAFPDGLQLAKDGFKKFENNQETVIPEDSYKIDGSTLSYKFPEESKIEEATFHLRLEMTQEEYKNYLISGGVWDKSYSNKASLIEETGTPPLVVSDPADTQMRMTFFTKAGEQNTEDRTKIDWTIGVNTKFSRFVNSFLVDMVDAADQIYDTDSGVSVTDIGGTLKHQYNAADMVNITSEFTEPYSGITNAVYQQENSDLNKQLESLKNRYPNGSLSVRHSRSSSTTLRSG